MLCMRGAEDAVYSRAFVDWIILTTIGISSSDSFINSGSQCSGMMVDSTSNSSHNSDLTRSRSAISSLPMNSASPGDPEGLPKFFHTGAEAGKLITCTPASLRFGNAEEKQIGVHGI